MTTATTAILTMALAAAATAQANTNPAGDARTTRSCGRPYGRILKGIDLIQAKHVSGQIMSSAGILVQWVTCVQSASTAGIDTVIDVIPTAPDDLHPEALAYALP